MWLRAAGVTHLQSRTLCSTRVPAARNRMETIDLTLLDDDDEEQREQSLKQAIMAQARGVLASLAPPAQAQRAEQPAEISGQEAAPVTGDPRPSTTATYHHKRPKTGVLEPASSPSSFLQPQAAPMNDLLRMLHQERQMRLGQEMPRPEHPQHAQGKSPGQPERTGASAKQAPRSNKRSAAEATAGRGRQASPGNSGRRAHQARVLGPNAVPTVSILNYNLWFSPDLLRERMQGLANIVLQEQPDIVMFQEVTPDMMEAWAADSVWMLNHYTWSVPPAAGYFTLLGYRSDRLTKVSAMERKAFQDTGTQADSVMGRDVVSVALSAIGSPPGTPPILVATSHLESPMGAGKMFVHEREAQLDLGFRHLHERAQGVSNSRRLPVDIVWGGDMNWNHSHAFEPQCPPGWADAWTQAHSHHPGHTWDPVNNTMLKYKTFKPARLDRLFTRLTAWQVHTIKLVGTEELPDLLLQWNKKAPTPVCVSDHFGILLKLSCPQSQPHRG